MKKVAIDIEGHGDGRIPSAAGEVITIEDYTYVGGAISLIAKGVTLRESNKFDRKANHW